MYRLLLLLQVLALPVFWIWPLAVALPIYATASVASLATYALVMKAMHLPVTNGSGALLDATDRAVARQRREFTEKRGLP